MWQTEIRQRMFQQLMRRLIGIIWKLPCHFRNYSVREHSAFLRDIAVLTYARRVRDISFFVGSPEIVLSKKWIFSKLVRARTCRIFSVECSYRTVCTYSVERVIFTRLWKSYKNLSAWFSDSVRIMHRLTWLSDEKVITTYQINEKRIRSHYISNEYNKYQFSASFLRQSNIRMKLIATLLLSVLAAVTG